MCSRTIMYIMGVIIGHCYGVKVYTNNCGTVSVAEPAIDGKRVLFTFVPKDQSNVREGGVTWKYVDGKLEHEPINSSRYNMMAYNSSFTLDLGCIKVLDERREYSCSYTTSALGCRSSWFKLALLDAPTNCGILYRQPKMIQHADEVVLEYYAPDIILEDGYYVRHLRRKNSKDCDDKRGCAVDVTWFEEEYSEYNSVYAYRIRNFTDEMNGNYTLQCTNRTHDNKITNYVRLVIPDSFTQLPPQIPTFLNTMDIDGHENCIAVKQYIYVTVRCDVEGGTFPVYVNMSIFGFDYIKECTIYKENVTCGWRMRLRKNLHLVGIRCEVSNEATVRPIATTATLYVLNVLDTSVSTRPFDLFLKNWHQIEGRDIDIACTSLGGQPIPKLSLLVNGKEINSTFVSVGSSYRSIKLNYLNRNWNGASLKCCMQHLYYEEPNCTYSEQVNYQFSPESTVIYTLTAATSDKKTFIQTLVCAVINANPACSVNWTYPSTLQVVIGARNETKPAGHGGFTTTSTLQFNGTKIINSQEMYCRAVCDRFRVSSLAKYNILIPYAPIITTNASKDTIWNVRDTVIIKCYADSFPLANLSWWDTANNTMATSNCGDKAICMEIKNVQMTDTGIYTCMADTELFDIEIQTVEIAIRSTRNAIKQEQNNEQTTLPWIIFGIAATLVMVVLAVIIAVVIVTKRINRRQKDNATENVSMDVLSQYSNLCRENIGSDIGTYDSLPDVMNANTTDETNPTNTDCPSTDDGAEHAEVIPKSQRQTEEWRDMSSTIKQDNHNLVYVDLDLNTDESTSKKYVTSNERTTEYVSIDFNRVGEPDVRSENIYANQ